MSTTLNIPPSTTSNLEQGEIAETSEGPSPLPPPSQPPTTLHMHFAHNHSHQFPKLKLSRWLQDI